MIDSVGLKMKKAGCVAATCRPINGATKDASADSVALKLKRKIKIMKTNLRKAALSCLTLAIVASLTGCMDAGEVLAEESAKFAICKLDQGQACGVSAPAGTKVEKASVASADDAVRVLGTVNSMTECEGFAAHSKSRSPKYIAQAAINNIVVVPYGEIMAHTPSVKTACAAPPYNVSLTVAKAP